MSIKFARLSSGVWGVRLYDEPGEIGRTVTVSKSDGSTAEMTLQSLVFKSPDGREELWETTDARPVYAGFAAGGSRGGRTRTKPKAEPIVPTVPTVPTVPVEPAAADEADGGFARVMALPFKSPAVASRLGVE